MSILNAIRQWNLESSTVIVVYGDDMNMQWLAYEVPADCYRAGMTEEQACAAAGNGGMYLYDWHLPEFEEKS